MSNFTSERVVPALPSDVYALVSDPAALARAGRPGSRVVADEQMPNGTRQVSLENRLSSGRTVNSTTLVLDAEQNERVVSRTAGRLPAGMFSFVMLTVDRTVTLEPHPDGTLVTTEFDWRFRPTLLGSLLRLLYRKRLEQSADAGMRAWQMHFEIAETEELEVTYEWTQADARAIRRWSLGRSPRIRIMALALLVSLVLGAAVEQTFWLLTLLVGVNLLAPAVRVLIRRRPLESESTVVLAIGPTGVRFTATEGGSEESTTLAWADLNTIKELPRYLIFLSRQSGIASPIVPKRAFDSVPNGLERLRQIGIRAGMGRE
jgi:hypothetical protein